MVCIYDLESTAIKNNGTVDNVHCIGIKVDDNETKMYTSRYIEGSDGSLSKAKEILCSADICVGHNVIGFDRPVLESLWGIELPNHLDTLIISKLMYSKDLLYSIDIGIKDMPANLRGMYSLAAWGHRLEDYKGEFNDWRTLSSDMLVYGKQDVDLTHRLYNYLIEQEEYPSDRVIQLEQDIAAIVQKQTLKGWYFNKEKADKLKQNMLYQKISLEHSLDKTFKPKFLKDGKEKESKGYRRKKLIPIDKPLFVEPYTIPLTRYKNGKFKFKKRKWDITPYKEVQIVTKGVYQPIKYTKFKPSSRKHIEIWLKDKYGWKPEHFTPKGNPKVDADTLAALPYKEADDLKTYLKLNKDFSQLVSGDGSILKAYDEKDNCIRHRCDTLGTNTFRMSHSSINISQIPSQKEFRELFIAPKDYKLVGADLSAQELRVLSEFLYPYDDGKYAHIVLNGDKKKGTDIHTLNQKAANLPSRDAAKTFIYALLYGSSTTRIGYSLYQGEEFNYTGTEYDEAKEKIERRLIDGYYPIAKDLLVPYDEDLIIKAIYGLQICTRFIDNTKGYRELLETTTKDSSKGWIEGLDGRRLPVRSAHSALNLKFQGGAAVITKVWVREAYNRFSKHYELYKDWYPNAIIHDEYDCSVKQEYAEEFGSILTNSAQNIHKELNLKVPHDAEYMIGNSWWDIH